MTNQKTLPPEAKGLNWGAFLLTWIWALGNATGCGTAILLFLLTFVPPIGQIVGLVKGNEWAWRAKDWASVDGFKATQRKWAMAGLIVLVVVVVLSCALGIVLPLLLGGGQY